MNKNIFGGTETKLVNYLDTVFQPEDSILKEVRERLEQKGLPHIQLGRMDSRHLEVLTLASGAKKAVEIGTLAGYSGISIARGLGEKGKLYTFELQQNYADVAVESFRSAGLLEKVEIQVGPALNNLNSINKEGPFDLVFIDADKPNYPNYLSWATEHLRVGGLLIADNTFAWGMIADEKFESKEDEESVRALQKFNLTMANGGRFRSTLLPTGEGLTIGVKIK